jgi:predicted nucleotidyltransferase component of viral defense system
VDSRWYRAGTDIVSFEPEETFATKLRALLQRRKGRDLFDLNEGLNQLSLNTAKLISCFGHYLALEGNLITRAVAEQRMLEKLARNMTDDIVPLLPAGIVYTDTDAIRAFGKVWSELVSHIAGDPWKQTEKVVEELRQKRYPDLLSGR